ncbi:MAG: hypothetical protein A2275_05870 [Bacteroidetes bacterium RIFOXYA12_FULL_35_11]|nr:MAG: hypothetical protein A2X01_00210 [Bacteroidetes bacterium GWF2_35_48]OFY78878.1 MAG: hypothetical protein A2275_05870 [Bacteroidetes bacterium RIFOXYA12_FULL_35_11]OFY92273.1 MAG: hypothetical protein A2309_02800 [Bacteroidetes bacterium RIFOXYB2_FULL_35_7]
MTKYKIKIIFLFLTFVFLITNVAFTQDRIIKLDKELKNLAKTNPSLLEMVDVSVSGVSIQEFLRGVASNVKVNISVDPSLQITVVNNFSDVMIIDMLLFLAKEHDLELSITGNIISVSKYNPPVKETPIQKPRELIINYNKDKDLLSYELNNDSLSKVTREITKQSDKNIVLGTSITGKTVNGFAQNMSFEKGIEMLAYSNDLLFIKNEEGIYMLDKPEPTKNNNQGNNANQNFKTTKKETKSKDTALTVIMQGPDSILVKGQSVQIADVVKEVSEKQGVNFCLISEIKGKTNINFSGITYEDILNNLFSGTDYTFKKQNDIYLIGETKAFALKSFKVIQLQNRMVDKIAEVIPAEYKKDVEVKEFVELNSLLVTGQATKIAGVEDFIRNIDKVVPVVLIEVMIADVTKKKTFSAGVNFGLGDNSSQKTQGSLFPTLDMRFSTNTINNLINSFNGFGWFNIGKVTPGFYLSIKALEENGILRLRSTPKLATLNGHEAKLTIGNTEYYVEEQNNVVGTQNPQNITTRTYKPVQANLSVTIKPYVSGDQQVTLDIKVTQSSFTARISESAPPGQVTRNFESLIRVKNEEMVLLGGLEEQSNSDTGSGVPFLSRIPVIKWLFSSRTKEKKNSRLNIFIKPTIIY